MRIRYLSAVSLIAIAVSGCTTTDTAPPTGAVQKAADAPLRADVNPNYKAGQMSIPTGKAADLNDILAQTDKAPAQKAAKSNEDKLRIPAMQEAASAYGAQAGLAYATRQINQGLEKKAGELTRTYNFTNLMIQGQNDSMLTPPVIVEATDAWEASDAGKTLRVSDKVYQIVEQSKFTPVAPLWQSYLIVNYNEPEQPPEQLLPQSDDEKASWKQWVTDGWKKGQEQAADIFQANLDRLNRDFIGMVRYRSLLEEGKVSTPIVGDLNMGTTGTGQDMRENDRLMRITQNPALQVKSKTWEAPVTTTDKKGEDVGVPANQTNVSKDAPAKAPERQAPPVHKKKKPVVHEAPKAAPKAAPKETPAKNVDKPTTSGANRF